MYVLPGNCGIYMRSPILPTLSRSVRPVSHLWVDEEVAEGEVVHAEAAGPGQAVGVGLHEGDQLAQHDAVRENVGLK